VDLLRQTVSQMPVQNLQLVGEVGALRRAEAGILKNLFNPPHPVHLPCAVYVGEGWEWCGKTWRVDSTSLMLAVKTTGRSLQGVVVPLGQVDPQGSIANTLLQYGPRLQDLQHDFDSLQFGGAPEGALVVFGPIFIEEGVGSSPVAPRISLPATIQE
jgi:hypothetical protein